VLKLKRVDVIEETAGGAVIMADSSEPTRKKRSRMHFEPLRPI
jgi:hypothetical protein